MSAEKKRWKWQRCRVVRADDRPDMLNKEAWAMLDSIEKCRVDRYRNGRLASYKISRVIEINIPHPVTGSLLSPDLECLEFLARSEDDFRDEVEMVSFADWLKQDDNAQQPAKADEEE